MYNVALTKWLPSKPVPLYHSSGKPILTNVFAESKFIPLKAITTCPTRLSCHEKLINITLIDSLHPFISLNQVSLHPLPFKKMARFLACESPLSFFSVPIVTFWYWDELMLNIDWRWVQHFYCSCFLKWIPVLYLHSF